MDLTQIKCSIKPTGDIFKNCFFYKTMKLWNSIPLAEEDWHMPIESSQYFIILFRVNQVFTFYHFIIPYGIRQEKSIAIFKSHVVDSVLSSDLDWPD